MERDIVIIKIDKKLIISKNDFEKYFNKRKIITKEEYRKYIENISNKN